MIPDSLLVQVAWVEGALLLVGWLVLLGSGVRSRLRRARERRLRSVRDLVTAALLEGGPADDARTALARLSRESQRSVFLLVAPSLRGRERAWLTDLAREAGLIRYGVRLCSSPFWWRRLRGARLLTLVGGGGSRVLELAGDSSPLVRAQAAEWCGANPSDTAVATLIGMLGDPSLASRFAVQDALVRLGGQVVEPLARRLRTVRNPTEAETALTVARAVGDGRLGPAIGGLVDHPDPRVRAAACRALGRSGGGEAAELLEAALSDDAAAVRAAAAGAMGELGYWQGGKQLVERLEDRAWAVRREAARSLVRLGAPGELLLRRARSSDDPFAADMAHFAMDVADVEQRGSV